MNNMTSQRRERLLRPIIIGIILGIVNCYWIVMSEALWFTVHITVISLFFNSVFFIFFIVLFNQMMRKYLPKSSMSNSEILIIYVMINMSSGMAAHGFMQLLLPIMGHAFWYATPENDWVNLFHRYLPTWLTIQDKKALIDHYTGNSTLYTVEHLKVWIVPVLFWTGFIFVFVFLMICINVIVRKQWVDQEKLAYPIIQVPYELIGQSSSLLRNKLLWIGFAVAASLDIMNGLHSLIPAVPYIHLKLTDMGRYFTSKPWNAIGWLPISFYPFVIGLAFFIPLDLSFSLWFFYLFWKMQRVLWYVLGFSSAEGSFSGYKSIIEQSSGAYLALFVVAMWVSRKHLWLVLKRVFTNKSVIDDSNEPVSYRTATMGLLIGGILLLIFCYEAGMSIWVAIIFFVVYFAIITAITRMRAEMGVPVHDMHNGGPDLLMTSLIGSRALGPQNVSILTLFWFFNRAHYSDIMPHQLEAFKLAEKTNTRGKHIFIAMLISVFVGIVATFWAFLHNSHHIGMAGRVEWFGWEPYNRLQGWISNPSKPDYSTGLFLGVGFVTTLFFTFMRNRFIWWPLHPAGYAVSNSWGLDVTWFPILLSFIIKSVILKFGGLKVHSRAIPFFAGLILGEFVIGSIWSIIGSISGLSTYAFWVY
ncbi:MAG: hypothetical protein QG641_1421 [Candidatus Poribacteria bacterium]|nr:hypothetical protein [Candidatus Poribacteria bacterium]